MTLASNTPERTRRNLLFTLSFLSLLAMALIAPLALGAQENDKTEVHHVGAHDIRVWPVNLNLGAGSAQYAVIVTDPATGDPVADARVMVLTSNPDAGEPGWAYATNSPAAPEQYDVHLKLDSTGEWTIGADVSSPLGADLLDVGVLEVPSVNRLTQGSWVYFGVFAAILGGIVYVWWSARRDYLRKRAARADTQ